MIFSIYKVVAILGITIMLGACGSSVSVYEFNKYMNDRHALRLLVQICLPDRTAFFDDVTVDITNVPEKVPRANWKKMFLEAKETRKYTNPYKSSQIPRKIVSIRQWRQPSNSTDYPKKWINIGKVDDVKGSRSMGSVPGGYLMDTTDRNQPVFNAYTHRRIRDLLAISVTFDEYRNGRMERKNYWYKPPTNIKQNIYTAWTLPHSEEGFDINADIGLKVIRGKDMPILKVNKGAPRIRYTVMSMKEYYKHRGVGRSAINFAKLERLTTRTSTDKRELYFVPKKRDYIPSC